MAQATGRRGEPGLPVLPPAPVSRTFGFDRGKPIDRWYIERFLAEHAADVRGRVLEVAESTYTRLVRRRRRHGVRRPATPPRATPRRPSSATSRPARAFPRPPSTASSSRRRCSSSTTSRAAVAGTRALLAPGGVLLATMPGISQISREDMRDWGDWWRFTAKSAERLFGEVYGDGARRGQAARQRPGGRRVPLRARSGGPGSRRVGGDRPRFPPADHGASGAGRAPRWRRTRPCHAPFTALAE